MRRDVATGDGDESLAPAGEPGRRRLAGRGPSRAAGVVAVRARLVANPLTDNRPRPSLRLDRLREHALPKLVFRFGNATVKLSAIMLRRAGTRTRPKLATSACCMV